MTTARARQIDLASTSYYHCVNRCVRRAFLCGEDALTGRSYEHRKQWVVDALQQLASVFAVDICAYAVMSNHYHVVLRVAVERAEGWSDAEVVARWRQLFKGHLLVERWRKGERQSAAEREAAGQLIAQWRQRLQDVSWFMRCLNESRARRANAEDGCTGRFWEGRFKSQALLDEVALLSAMVYVDLNPVRAGLSDTAEASDYTSIQARIRAWRQSTAPAAREPATPEGLAAFAGDTCGQAASPERIPFTLLDYFELVDWSGRAVRGDKRGAIAAQAPRLLDSLGLDRRGWLQNVVQFNRRFPRLAGTLQAMRARCDALGQRYARGMGAARGLCAAGT